MPFGKKFFRLQNFGALQVPDLGRKPLRRGRNDAKRRKKRRMAVPRDDLRRDGLNRKPEPLRDIGFDPRIDIGVGANSPGNRASRNFRAGADEPFAGAQKFGVGSRELQPESCWLGMDAMRAADHGG
jgi:hypothetical protein